MRVSFEGLLIARHATLRNTEAAIYPSHQRPQERARAPIRMHQKGTYRAPRGATGYSKKHL